MYASRPSRQETKTHTHHHHPLHHHEVLPDRKALPDLARLCPRSILVVAVAVAVVVAVAGVVVVVVVVVGVVIVVGVVCCWISFLITIVGNPKTCLSHCCVGTFGAKPPISHVFLNFIPNRRRLCPALGSYYPASSH